jgi:hypothetical protein
VTGEGDGGGGGGDVPDADGAVRVATGRQTK